MKTLLSLLAVLLLLTGCDLPMVAQLNSPKDPANGGTGNLLVAPPTVSASAGDGQVTLQWHVVSVATSYNVYWSNTSGVTPLSGTKITSVTSPYTQTGLTDGMSYFYVVTAANSSGESAPSAQVSSIPQVMKAGAPTGVSAVSGNGQVTLSWPTVSGATSYNLYWSTTTGVTVANGTKVANVTSPYTQTGLSNGTSYYYVLTALNAGGESNPSGQVVCQPSLPATAWTARQAPISGWLSVTYGNGKFVAVSSGSSAMYSPDGSNWTLSTLPSSSYWDAVTFGNGIFVAVAYNAAGVSSATSSDGITWTAGNLASFLWATVAFGNGLFITTSNNFSPSSAKSTDGVTWTEQGLGTPGYYNSLAFGNGIFVAVANSATVEGGLISSNGTTWSSENLNVASAWQAVAFGNGVFVAIGGGNFVTSPDGITWTPGTLPLSRQWQSLVYGNGVFVAVANSDNSLLVSADGTHWNQRTLPTTSSWQSVAYGNGQFVAVSSSKDIATSP